MLIIALIAVESPVVQFHNYVANTVQEVAVVGNHKKGTAAAFEEGFEIFNGVYIQMIGGLIHYIEVCIHGKHLAERHPLDLASTKAAHKTRRVVQTEIAELFAQSLHKVLLLFIRESLSCLLRRIQHLVHNAQLGIKVIVLGQERYTYLSEKHHFASTVTAILPCQYPHKGSLAAAIRRNEGDFVALIDIESYIFEENFLSIGFGQVLNLEVAGHPYLASIAWQAVIATIL